MNSLNRPSLLHNIDGVQLATSSPLVEEWTEDPLLFDGLKTTKVDASDGELYAFEAQVTATLACWECKLTTGLRLNGHRAITVVDAPMRGRTVSILVNRQRFYCPRCKMHQTEQLPAMASDHHMTERCLKYIQGVTFNETFAKTARDVGVDDSLIRNISNEWAAHLKKSSNATLASLRWMGIDDVKVAGKVRIVITDLEHRIPVDLLELNTEECLEEFIEKLPDPNQIEVVCTDMAVHFIDTVAMHLTKAQHVFDRWHLTEFGRDGVSNVRKKIQSDLLKNATYYEKAPSNEQRELRQIAKSLKKLAIYLRRRRSDISIDPGVHVEMRKWFDQYPALEQAYNLKEQYLQILESKNIELARTRMAKWIDDVAPYRVHFKRAVRAITAYEELFLVSINYPNISNGFTEAQNGELKTISRVGRGYSFDRLRARFLYRKLYVPKARKLSEVKSKNALAQRRQDVQKLIDAGLVREGEVYYGHNYSVMKCRGCRKMKPVSKIAKVMGKSAYSASKNSFPDLSGKCVSCRDILITSWTKLLKARPSLLGKPLSGSQAAALNKSSDKISRRLKRAIAQGQRELFEELL